MSLYDEMQNGFAPEDDDEVDTFSDDQEECECDFDLEDDDEDEREDFFVDEDCPNFSEPCFILGCNNCSYHD